MSIYPVEGLTKNPDGTLTETWHVPGLTRTRILNPGDWVEERTNCFCCSCDDYSHDPYCRNHGFAGTRPCDTHKMPGAADEDGEMPESVDVVNARRRREFAS